MAKYKSEPEEVEAYELKPENHEFLAYLTGGRMAEEIDPTDPSKKFVALNINTANGVRRASEGDFIIQRKDGYSDILPAHLFHMRYHEV